MAWNSPHINLSLTFNMNFSVSTKYTDNVYLGLHAEKAELNPNINKKHKFSITLDLKTIIS